MAKAGEGHLFPSPAYISLSVLHSGNIIVRLGTHDTVVLLSQ
jgi:hypothetical protein